MQFHLASFFAILAAVCINAQTLQINTPTNVIQCLPQLITWSGGTGPYFVVRILFLSANVVLPGGQPGASALVDFGEQSGTQLTWVVNIAAGTSVGLSIRDQTGTVASSAPFTIGSGSDSSCVGSSAETVSGSSTVALSATSGAASGSTTAASGSSTGSSSSGTSHTSTSGSSTATKTSASSSGSSTSGSSSSTSSSAAKPFAQIGSAGVIGAVVAAIFA